LPRSKKPLLQLTAAQRLRALKQHEWKTVWTPFRKVVRCASCGAEYGISESILYRRHKANCIYAALLLEAGARRYQSA
jgi:hypothetical protein